MSDPTEEPGLEDPSETRTSAEGIPRWVTVSLVVVAVLVALFVVLNIAGIGGQHGPGRHMPGRGPTHQPIDHSR